MKILQTSPNENGICLNSDSSLCLLWAGWHIIRNPILRSLVVGEIAQQYRAEVLHCRVIVHIPEHRRAVVAAG